jgi:acetyl-CoA C-acetyltransferase
MVMMNSARDVVVLSGVRTAIGRYGGSLKDTPPSELAAQVVRESVARARIKPADVGHVVFGHVIHTDAQDMYLSRVAAVKGGLPVETPALTLNRLCGSGLQAIVSAAQMIALGDVDAAVAGGAESMSRGAYWLPAMRWGQRLNDGVVVDATVGALTDPFDDCHMGTTAEAVAAKWAITREEQDALAVESQRRAAAATAAGSFIDLCISNRHHGRKDTDRSDAVTNERRRSGRLRTRRVSRQSAASRSRSESGWPLASAVLRYAHTNSSGFSSGA